MRTKTYTEYRVQCKPGPDKNWKKFHTWRYGWATLEDARAEVEKGRKCHPEYKFRITKRVTHQTEELVK